MNSDDKALLSVTELPAIFVAVVIVVALASFCLGRRLRLPGLNIHDVSDDDDRRSGNEQQRQNDDVVVVVEESPKMALWSQEKLKKEMLVNWSCSVCLGDCGTSDDSDALRLLPDCGHVFHRACVDSWLRLRPTCPLCRIAPRGVVFKSPVVGDRGVSV